MLEASRSCDVAPVTQLLVQWRNGDERALESLMPLIYQHLRLLARHRLNKERRGHTFQPTDLVHEAYVRLRGKDRPHWQDRSHFFAVAALTMRRVLVDHARAQKRQRRGEGAVRVELQEAFLPMPEASTEIASLDAALQQLERQDPRKAQVVQLRYFGGLTLDEVAEVLKVAQVTVVRDWRLARAWLLREMSPASSAILE